MSSSSLSAYNYVISVQYNAVYAQQPCNAYAHNVLSIAHAHGVPSDTHAHRLSAAHAHGPSSSSHIYHQFDSLQNKIIRVQASLSASRQIHSIVQQSKPSGMGKAVVAGPLVSRTYNGPISPLNNSCALDVLFTSPDPLRNIIVGDLYCVFATMDHHSIPSQGLTVLQARQALI